MQLWDRVREVVLTVAVAAISFGIYMSNGQTLASYDSAPNSLLALDLLEEHRLDFDLFRGSYFRALGGQYAFTEAPNGHLASVFPVGTALVTAPLYGVFYLARHGKANPAIYSSAFEPIRQHDEKIAAAVVAAISVALFLLCAREFVDLTRAAIATAVYALATSVWSTCSQALWQHGPVNLFVLAMTYALLRASRAREPTSSSCWLAAAGIFAGLLPVIRPTAVLFSAAGFIYACWTFRRRGWLFVATSGLGVAPGIAWNAYFFHSLAGGYAYAGIAYSYFWAPRRALTTLAALLLSPSRGVFVFSPVLAFSLAGPFGAARVRQQSARLIMLLAAACAALVLQYACFSNSLVGFSYGPRYLSDTAAVAGLLLVYVIPKAPLSSIRRNAAAAAAAAVFTLTFVFSIGVQFVGTNSGAAGSEWNAIPLSVDREPDRVWQVRDNQIQRNWRAAYARFFAWDRARSTGYLRQLASHVTALSPSFADVAKGSTIDATATLRNDGRSPAYGYDSGVYIGQMRIRVRILDAWKRTASEQFLYVRGTPAWGDRADAIGAITMPTNAGTYIIECVPVLVGPLEMNDRPAPFRVIVHVS
jgi:hypothetical protein